MFLQFVICFSIRCDKSLKVVIRPSIFTFFKNFILLIFFLKFLCSFVTCCNLPEAVQFYITIRPSAGHAIQPYCIVLYVLYCIVLYCIVFDTPTKKTITPAKKQTNKKQSNQQFCCGSVPSPLIIALIKGRVSHFFLFFHRSRWA